MTHSYFFGAALILATSFIFTGCGNQNSSSTPPSPQSKSDEQKKISDLNSEVQDQKSKIENLTSEKETLSKKVADLQEMLNGSPANTAQGATDLQNRGQIVEALKSGQTVPVFVFAYGEPGSPEFDSIRRQIKIMDANPIQNQNRDRQFSSYPYTVMMNLITLNNVSDLQSLLNLRNANSKVKIVPLPVQTFNVQTFATIDYSAPIVGRSESKTIWVGSSPPVKFAGNYSDFKLSDVSSYVPFMSSCRYFNAECFQALLEQGYFQQESIIDGRAQIPLDFLRKELGESAYLREKGFNGGRALFGKALFNSNFDRRVISDIKITHELWVSSQGYDRPIPEILYKVVGYDQRAVVVPGADGVAYFKLPVRVSGVDIPLEMRAKAPQMKLLTSKLVHTIDNFREQKSEILIAQ